MVMFSSSYCAGRWSRKIALMRPSRSAAMVQTLSSVCFARRTLSESTSAMWRSIFLRVRTTPS